MTRLPVLMVAALSIIAGISGVVDAGAPLTWGRGPCARLPPRARLPPCARPTPVCSFCHTLPCSCSASTDRADDASNRPGGRTPAHPSDAVGNAPHQDQAALPKVAVRGEASVGDVASTDRDDDAQKRGRRRKKQPRDAAPPQKPVSDREPANDRTGDGTGKSETQNAEPQNAAPPCVHFPSEGVSGFSGTVAVGPTMVASPVISGGFIPSRPALVAGSRVSAFVNFLQHSEGAVWLQIAGATWRCHIARWCDDSVTFDLPNLGLSTPIDATVQVIRPDGRVAKSVGVTLVPPPLLVSQGPASPRGIGNGSVIRPPRYAE